MRRAGDPGGRGAGGRGGELPPRVAAQLWRGVVVFRIGALVYAAARIVGAHRGYAHPAGGLAVLGAMVGWTALMTVANSTERGRRWPVLLADLAVCLALTVSSLWVQTYQQSHGGTVTLTTTWTAAPMLGLAVRGGPWVAAAAAAVLGAGAVVTRQALTLDTVSSVVLLFLAGPVIGYVARLAIRAERQLAAAIRLEAVTRERERLARGIHDGVLQVLTLVQRRGSEIGGEAAELARLAGEQEVALRGLVAGPPAGPDPADVAGSGGGQDADGGPVDLCGLLAAERSSHVTLSAPAAPVPLPPHVARELAAAVRAALDNVVRHAGADARAWVLVEDLGGEVVVSVRDDGPGIPPGRLDEAAAEGRLGVALSMRGRVAELGGAVSMHSAPGEGTEVELRVPRRPAGATGRARGGSAGAGRAGRGSAGAGRAGGGSAGER
jgi:signal transduction histidine kinase